ncbi:1-deoxy-D-xylulose 5-phosphate reductoisomerase [Elstera cyanobacteriorum]|uniref:1-deoxy-D-xylulose 5-phosphate reductoisomerase n=1 Tax=Elstera cyanobacteriorum TaxID=2022747 RepID=A0A255XN71_9PROT|nr:1-deoxy-D-xylulose-5-phosphate reductoisomerase [Elstera cyanobacteriorum]OYQ18427.1 1-deoxy-D-xylulose-5-phosphate reductoisomerase [Elstera cyanobacteriorum]GFZ80335.1 1-deoxy-D-xylulose 5-phosphate reductoisomerase [Elstera cyanobacteriorum]
MSGGVKRVTVQGCTGSVGQSTLDVIRHHRGRFAVEALVAGQKVDALIRDALEFRPRLAVIADPAGYGALQEGLAGTGIEVAAGPQAVIEAALRPVDVLMAAIVGAAGLPPTLAALEQGTTVAFANKEVLVSAGDLVMATAARTGARLLPVDSEHNAIFQVFETEARGAIDKILLTASGGPFRTWSAAAMAAATPAQAVAHPNWSMGAKISVDSATMMNKGLELIEAHYLFEMSENRIEVLIHPQSVIHSAVVYCDGSVLAQLGSPDMRTPIAYALGWPQRLAVPVPTLDLIALAKLTFEAPDDSRFPALRLARQVLRDGQGAPTLLNAANEVAVAAFLAHRLPFDGIAETVVRVLERVPGRAPDSLETVLALDAAARAAAAEITAALAC